MKIFNNYLEATFKTKGAELVSLKNKDDKEYIWQANPDHWGRYAPVLFPIVGRLKNDAYKYQATRYEMSQHGFARDVKFNIIEQDDTHIRFSFTSIDDTLKVYPFRFELLITYTLKDARLEVSYEVRNLGSETLYFSIGGHPAFNCPMTIGESKIDYWLEFEKEETAETYLLESGLFSGETRKVIDKNLIRITNSLFDHDALVFKNLKSSKVSLVSPFKKWLTFEFSDFPYLGIWSKSAKSPFVCIEPWLGIADNSDHDQDLTKKEGIQKLDKSESLSCAYAIEIH